MKLSTPLKASDTSHVTVTIRGNYPFSFLISSQIIYVHYISWDLRCYFLVIISLICMRPGGNVRVLNESYSIAVLSSPTYCHTLYLFTDPGSWIIFTSSLAEDPDTILLNLLTIRKRCMFRTSLHVRSYDVTYLYTMTFSRFWTTMYLSPFWCVLFFPTDMPRPEVIANLFNKTYKLHRRGIRWNWSIFTRSKGYKSEVPSDQEAMKEWTTSLRGGV